VLVPPWPLSHDPAAPAFDEIADLKRRHAGRRIDRRSRDVATALLI